MATPTDKQLTEILRRANKLTGQACRYLSQNLVGKMCEVKNAAEASAILDQLAEAIDTEQQRRKDTGIQPGVKIAFRYTKKDGSDGGRLSGVVERYAWSGLEVAGVYLHSMDASQATFEASSTNWWNFRRMSQITTGEGPGALRAERAQLQARIAEIDAILAAQDAGQ